jgi:hypothetical protein
LRKGEKEKTEREEKRAREGEKRKREMGGCRRRALSS